MRGQIQYELLTCERAQRDGVAIVGLGADNPWEYWTVENLLSERTDKWLLSLLATIEDAPVAYAVASRQNDAVHVHHLIVAPTLRGQGVGAEMMRRLSINAQQTGATRLTLKVYRQNEKAVRFYQRLGFAIVGDHGDELLKMESDITTLLSTKEHIKR